MSNYSVNFRSSRKSSRSPRLPALDALDDDEDEGRACLDTSPLMCGGSDSFDIMDENDRLVKERRRGRFRSRGVIHFLTGGWTNLCSLCCSRLWSVCCREKELQDRTVHFGLGRSHTEKYPRNVVRNQKYSIITFIPKVLFEQFKFFLNLYFLIMALSQLIPELRIGYLYTYWGPLAFVLFVTMCREALDDYRRYRRDKEANSQRYKKLTRDGIVRVPSSDIQVGHLIIVEKNQRVPADIVLLRTSEKDGGCFIRTDQLDGETDWKLRLAVQVTQRLPTKEDILDITAHVYAEKPQRNIHSFVGTFTRSDGELQEDSLSIENTLWANTIVASGTALGVVIYTGPETRSVMNTSQPKSKVGLLDLEVNTLTKLLFFAVMVLALVMVALKTIEQTDFVLSSHGSIHYRHPVRCSNILHSDKIFKPESDEGFGGPWYRYYFRYVLLFSYIIPISLRVNLDMGKAFYSWIIQRDKNIPGTTVRSTTIPEELGRITYLLSDKTGTLTQNEMIFKRLHLGTVSFTPETMDEVISHLKMAYSATSAAATPTRTTGPVRRNVLTRVSEAVKAIALCHNVTPVYDDNSSNGEVKSDDTEADQQLKQRVTYQASSPDEIALVTWAESVKLTLMKRDLNTITLKTPTGSLISFTILQIFPFTSESKRMGIIVRDQETGEITFYLKGADVVMQSIVQYNDWLEEECGNMAREGLRTLVVAKKTLSEEQYQEFESRYHQAKMSIQERNSKMQNVVEGLERDMELLCLTGVEDKLQEGVRPTLELLRNAGIKVWMLTGDKLETAICIAKSSKLVSRLHEIYVFGSVSERGEAHLELNALRRKNEAALIVTGDSLQVCLKYYEHEFVELACQCPAVVVCRCSPTQKAEIVKLLKTHTGMRTSAVGDGGNDVSMIQAADAGIGIVGKEGKQASLAADFSITQFSHIARLLIVHGRNSYKRSASLGQFVIHRGLIITTMQVVFCSVFYFVSIALFPGFLMVGYATVYTMFPVFSLVLDKDVSADVAITYPELYKDLTKGRSLSFKTFFLWVLISIYQGGIIMYGALLLFEAEFIHVVSITFTSLILTELLMVGLTVRTWHYLMILAQFLSLALYIISLAVLRNYFDARFLQTWDFVWKVLVITSISCIPLYVLKYIRKKFSPPVYSKLTP